MSRKVRVSSSTYQRSRLTSSLSAHVLVGTRVDTTSGSPATSVLNGASVRARNECTWPARSRKSLSPAPPSANRATASAPSVAQVGALRILGGTLITASRLLVSCSRRGGGGGERPLSAGIS